MLSAFSAASAEATTQALALGAFDFVLKPNTANPHLSSRELKDKLQSRVEALLGKVVAPSSPRERQLPTASAETLLPRTAGLVEMVVIGVSTGGPNALATVLPSLPADLAAPVLIVQHMPPMFTKSLADDLNRRCGLTVREAAEGDPIQAGHALIAPGGRQMKVEVRDGRKHIKLTDDPPECACRPSVDYLFRSAAHVSGGAVLAVIMTGMGSDGTLGLRLLKRKGAKALAQSKETCVVFGMPALPIAEGLVDEVLPLEALAAGIERHAGRR
jgi:two-component system chemotaxis response regulator CheB